MFVGCGVVFLSYLEEFLLSLRTNPLCTSELGVPVVVTTLTLLGQP